VAFSILFAGDALARAQSNLEWLASYNAAAGLSDKAVKCAVDANGNVYACGTSYFAAWPTRDVETVKYSPAGVELWHRRFYDPGFVSDAGDIAVDSAGDVYVTCTTASSSSARLDLIKYKSDGTFLWSRTYGGPPQAGGIQIEFDAADNAIVLGYVYRPVVTAYDALVVGYSPSGQFLWATNIDGPTHGNDIGLALAITQSGDIYVAGQMMVDPVNNGDLLLARLNASGALQWTRTVDGGGSAHDMATAIAVAGNDRIAIAGYAGNGAGGDLAVVEFDAAGSASTLRKYDGPLHGADQACAAAIDASGVLWVLGASLGIGSSTDFVMLRYGAAGQLLTTKRYNGPAHRADQPVDLVLGGAGGAWACGYSYGPSGLATDTDVVLVQYDADGRELFANRFSTAGIFDDRIVDADPAPNGRIALAGWTTGSTGGDDYLALQLDLNALPQGYCTAKVNSLGCTPIVDFTGLSSASAASGFVVRSSIVRNHKSGLLFYGVSGTTSLPFQGGTLCVQAPIRRTPVVDSHGAASPANDCSGMFALDLNAFAAGALGGTPLPALLVAGTQVYCQWWGRDPGFPAPDNTALSSGMRYRVLP
jgi:hypothetical protein